MKQKNKRVVQTWVITNSKNPEDRKITSKDIDRLYKMFEWVKNGAKHK